MKTRSDDVPPKTAPLDDDSDMSDSDDELMDSLLAAKPVFAARRPREPKQQQQQRQSRAELALQNAMASLENQRLQNRLVKAEKEQQASTSLTTTVKKFQQRTRDERDGVLGLYRDHAELEFSIYEKGKTTTVKMRKKNKNRNDHGELRRKKSAREVIADRKKTIDAQGTLPLGSLLTLRRGSRSSSSSSGHHQQQKQGQSSSCNNLELFTTYDEAIRALDLAIVDDTGTTTTTIVTALKVAKDAGKVALTACLYNTSLVDVLLAEQQQQQGDVDAATTTTTTVPDSIANWLFVLAASSGRRLVGTKLADGACQTLLGLISHTLLSDSFYSKLNWQFCRDTIGVFVMDFRGNHHHQQQQQQSGSEGRTTIDPGTKKEPNISSGGRTYVQGLFNLLKLWKARISNCALSNTCADDDDDDDTATTTATTIASRLTSDLLLLLLDETLHCRRALGDHRIHHAVIELLLAILDQVAKSTNNKNVLDGCNMENRITSKSAYQQWVDETVNSFWEEDLDRAIAHTEDERDKIKEEIKHYDDHDGDYYEQVDEALKWKVQCHLIRLLSMVNTTITAAFCDDGDIRRRRQRLFELQRAGAKKALEHCCNVSDFDLLAAETVQRRPQQNSDNSSCSSFALASLLQDTDGKNQEPSDHAGASSSFRAMAYALAALEYLNNRTCDNEFIKDQSRVFAVVFGAAQSFLAGWNNWNVLVTCSSSAGGGGSSSRSSKQEAEIEVELLERILTVAQDSAMGYFFNKNYHSREIQRADNELTSLVKWLVEIQSSSMARAGILSSSRSGIVQQSVQKYFKVKSPTK